MQKYPHCMIDLETLGTKSGCVILSLGACLFDPSVSRPAIGPSFYVVFNRKQQQEDHPERFIDSDTAAWWKQQSPEAQRVFDEPQTEVAAALGEFDKYLNAFSIGQNVEMWGNGADFDNVLLDDLYEWVNIKRPWGTYNNRCFRTLKQLHRKFYNEAVTKFPRIGAHNARGDAEWQTFIACFIMGKVEAALAVVDAVSVFTAPDGELHAIPSGPERDDLQTALGIYERV